MTNNRQKLKIARRYTRDQQVIVSTPEPKEAPPEGCVWRGNLYVRDGKIMVEWVAVCEGY